MTQHSIIPSPIPYCSTPRGWSSNPVLVHHMINNIPGVSLQIVEIRLAWFRSEYTNLCHACKRPLVKDTIIGEGYIRSSEKYHLGCVTVENKNQIMRCEVKVEMKRKSRRYPDKVQAIEFIGTPLDLLKYQTEIQLAGYNVIDPDPRVARRVEILKDFHYVAVGTPEYQELCEELAEIDQSLLFNPE